MHLLHEDEVDSKNEADKSGKVVPLQAFTTKKDDCE